jgi:hypothetical protein
MEELVTNLHIHTVFSDGSEKHKQIAEAAHTAGLDVVIFTDHNLYVQGVEGYYRKDYRDLLMLSGEEIHDQTLNPQRNHLLVLGMGKEMSTLAHQPQLLIDQASRSGALTFLAHPFERAVPALHQRDISWDNWSIKRFTGIELWNGFSELKYVLHNKLDALFYAFFPMFIHHGPPKETLKKWDELLVNGSGAVAVAGADAHGLKFSLGPKKITVLPYLFHFRTINNHILVPEPLSGEIVKDRRMVLEAFRKGSLFIGYDLPFSTSGFRFTAQGRNQTVTMGEEIQLNEGVTLQIRLPLPVECRLLKDGKNIRLWRDREVIMQYIDTPGVYRVESYIQYLGKKRGWIYSNPIFVTEK